MEGGKITSSKLYQFELPLSARIKNRSNFLSGIVRNKITNQPLEAELNLVNINTGEKVSRVKSDMETGKYFVVLTEGQEYGIFINKPGYLFQNLNYNYLEKDTLKPEILDIYLSPISSGAETVLKNIFFQTNEFQLEEKSFVELKNVVQFLTVNPTIRVEISGHTDNTGTAKSNLELSNKRAQSVVDFLVASGISKARITYLGFGDKKPIGTNETEEGKALNRRIAFKIL
jgi:outer membrane protein OmpA-like peptidoglycan-associated protein